MYGLNGTMPAFVRSSVGSIGIRDADGTIVHKHIGPIDRQIWETEFVPIIERLQGGSG